MTDRNLTDEHEINSAYCMDRTCNLIGRSYLAAPLRLLHLHPHRDLRRCRLVCLCRISRRPRFQSMVDCLGAHRRAVQSNLPYLSKWVSPSLTSAPLIALRDGKGSWGDIIRSAVFCRPSRQWRVSHIENRATRFDIFADYFSHIVDKFIFSEGNCDAGSSFSSAPRSKIKFVDFFWFAFFKPFSDPPSPKIGSL